MDIGLRLERGSLITIVWTINFIVFSTRLAAIGKSLPKYISAYEMDGYKDVFIIFILRQQIPTLGSGPCDCSCWRQTVKAGIQRSERRREIQWKVRREYRHQRAASASTKPGADFTCNRTCLVRSGLHSHSRHSNSARDWPCGPFHCFQKQMEANIYILFVTFF